MGRGFETAEMAQKFNDDYTVKLNQKQADGTESVIPEGSGRNSLKIVPPSKCYLTLKPGDTAGIPLFAGVANEFSGVQCPSNPLFIYGLAKDDVVVVWSA